jgi:hypothetical protein
MAVQTEKQLFFISEFIQVNETLILRAIKVKETLILRAIKVKNLVAASKKSGAYLKRPNLTKMCA